MIKLGMRFVSNAMNDEGNVSDFTGACFEDPVTAIIEMLKTIEWADEGTDPLQWAIRRRDGLNAKIANLLLEAGSPVDGQSLYLAERYAPDLFFLIPDPKMTCVRDVRALDLALLDAARWERADHISRLLKLGASAETVDYFYGYRGWTALHHICWNSDVKSYKVIFPEYYYIDVHRVTNDNDTSLALLENSEKAAQRKAEAELIRKDLLERMAKP